MKFFIASPWKNINAVKNLSDELKKRGYGVYSFIESSANLMTGMSIEDELTTFGEALKNWESDPRIKLIFNSEIGGLRSSDALILLEPSGRSSLLEAGVAYGMGKKTILVGQIKQPKVAYFIFDRIYPTTKDFLDDLDNFVRAEKKQ